MWGKRAKLLEGLLTVATAAAFVGAFFAARAYRSYAVEKTAVSQGPRPGTAVSLPGVNWKANRLSLVFVMQVGCHWCEASAGFDKALLRSDSAGAFHPIAVLPQPVSDAKTFLKSLGLNIPDVRQASLAKLGAPGTPTLILVDSAGRVEGSWVGKLPPDWEGAVFKKIGIRRLEAD